MIGMLLVRLLKLPSVLNGMFTRDETEIALPLNPKVLEDDFDLVVLADDVVLFAVSFFLSLLAIFLVLVAGRQGEAGVALKQVTNPMELLPELLFALVVQDIHQQLVDNATEAPEVGSLVVGLLDQGDLRSPVPPRADVEGHEPLHLFPPRPVFIQDVLE